MYSFASAKVDANPDAKLIFVAYPAINDPSGIVTIPVNVGEAIGA